MPMLIFNITSCPATGNLLALVGINNLTIPDIGAALDLSTLSSALNTSTINAALAPVYDALSLNFTSLIEGFDLNGMRDVNGECGGLTVWRAGLSLQLANVAGNLTIQGLGGPTTPRAQSALDSINSVTFSESGVSFVFANVSLMNVRT
jgi:hypothetical protein